MAENIEQQNLASEGLDRRTLIAGLGALALGPGSSSAQGRQAKADRGAPANDYLICRSTEVDDYSVWCVDLDDDKQLLKLMPGHEGAKFDRNHQLIAIGDYVLEWGPLTLQDYKPSFPFRLFRFDPSIKNPLGVRAVNPGELTSAKTGTWEKKKFWGTRPDFGNPEGPAKEFDKGEKLMLLPLSSYILNVIPTTGRGTFKLFYFDPESADPLYLFPTWVAGAFETIEFGHELIPMGNYVLDRLNANRKGGGSDYWLWSFDPMNDTPLARPARQQGHWSDIDKTHQLIPIGEYLLDWDMEQGSYRLWGFDPEQHNPLIGPVRKGSMPKEFGSKTTLTAIQGLRPIDETNKEVPGTIDFMRSKIKHVVYYMLENRSFDHVCGWLYEKGEGGINFVGPEGPFDGASTDMFNLDVDVYPRKKVHLKKHEGGEFFLPSDPYHDMTDTMRQFFFEDRDGYAKRATPNMGGFVWNNGTSAIMSTFTPEQLPVLNGLAKAFAISDRWFCSMPGATDSQRAFALTGSALGELNNFMNGPQYTGWPDLPRRASIWKVLWANGFKNWKIYNSVEWIKFVLTYHLFLQGQIPTVDNDQSARYVAGIEQFKKDASEGRLPAFSFLEPVWIAADKPATSYHPYGSGGTMPGEKALNEIYDALRTGPNWNETLLIITFDEHGGFFDHVPPPYTRNPWPNDIVDGFRYDIMGVRVPTILVSPWIREQTVFRSPTEVAYDSTSILATLLTWYGIPKGRWGLGDRTQHAPTFEGVFQCQSPRTDAPTLSPPEAVHRAASPPSEGLSDLHQQIVPRLVDSIVGGRRTARETSDIANKILERATDEKSLNALINDLANRMK
jgi:phospholipase C